MLFDKVDLVIRNAGQLLTLRSKGPEIGKNLGDLGIVEDGAVAVRDGRISWVGRSQGVSFPADQALDARGRVVMPGFVDPHTHLVFAGSREDEFELRLKGASYTEIAERGGGIRSTVRATRKASGDELFEAARSRLDAMLSWGTTTAEAKSGYGLTVADELKMLEVIERLGKDCKADLAPTFLGAHEVPDEYRDNREAYVQLLIDEMIPQVAERHLAQFCDVFCEKGVFDADESGRILRRGKEFGLRPKIHADELSSCGGAELAGEIEAISAGHLNYASDKGLAAMREAGTAAVLLPGASLFLGKTEPPSVRKMIDLGLPIALATDFNPGSSPIYAMPIILSLACVLFKLTPAEAITASTLNAAYAIGRGERAGSIQVGKDADLLILNVRDYREIPYWFGSNPVETVIKRGQIIRSSVKNAK